LKGMDASTSFYEVLKGTSTRVLPYGILQQTYAMIQILFYTLLQTPT
jgi:hypothetical protein